MWFWLVLTINAKGLEKLNITFQNPILRNLDNIMNLNLKSLILIVFSPLLRIRRFAI